MADIYASSGSPSGSGKGDTASAREMTSMLCEDVRQVLVRLVAAQIERLISANEWGVTTEF